MKKTILVLACLILFGFTLTVSAQEIELPKPGLTPDSPFYVFETFFENVGLFLTFGNSNKAKKLANLAGKRIAEARAMVDENKPEEAQGALERYEKHLQTALGRIKNAKSKGEETGEATKTVAEVSTKHLEVLDAVLGKVPEEAKEGIERARTVSMTGQQEALKVLAEENPEEATRINLKAAESRLERTRKESEEGDVLRMREAVEEFENQYRFGEEISDIAKGQGKNTTTVEQLVGKATGAHLEVLADVYERVPEEAKSSIEEAMVVSVKGHEEAVRALRGKNAMNDVSEEVSLPEQVPQNIRERIHNRVREIIEGEMPGGPGMPEEPGGSEEPGSSGGPGMPEEPGGSEEPGTPQGPQEGKDGEEVKLEITAMDGGTTLPVPGNYLHAAGEEVTVEGVSDSGFEFQLWEREGDGQECDQYEKECTFTINEDSMLAAHFIEEEEGGVVTSCSEDDECRWVSTNCCSENAGAQWECVNEGETEINCPDNPVCPQVISPKPETSCECINGECQEN